MELKELYEKYCPKPSIKMEILRFLDMNHSKEIIYQDDLEEEFNRSQSFISEVVNILKDDGLLNIQKEQKKNILYITELGTTLIYKIFPDNSRRNIVKETVRKIRNALITLEKHITKDEMENILIDIEKNNF